MSVQHWFYHLERSGLDDVLPDLLEKTRSKGWTALVQVPSEPVLDHLDNWLWIYRDEAFLPHGRADRPDAERQPIVLTIDRDDPISADVIFSVGCVPLPKLDKAIRCITLFTDRDEEARSAARLRWKDLKAQNADMSYWRQDANGKWGKQA